MRQRSQSAVPSVAKRRVDGSRVAVADGLDSFLRPLLREPALRLRERDEQRDGESGQARARDHEVDAPGRGVGAREEAVERRGEDRRAREREPDHAADRLHGADEGDAEDEQLERC